MTLYDDDNLPEVVDVDPLPAELFEAAKAAFIEAMNSPHIKAQHIKAVHAFERKDELSTSDVALPPNESYGSETDDFIFEFTIRIPNPTTLIRGGGLTELAAFDDTAKKYQGSQF